ncbi:Riboflavin transporter [Ascidiaceihabitans donghaensis]|uniref:Riboflavin transporter n=1 Tax=Ascidiaceihabitans donghaensis TaxID=1510460 RepID=A0A2R8B9K4_9RHOB|nr:DMT family transporter [Ascidiaceihabitans donghaensis]SPH19553.1 Riboflavin transporter [Ascidiaceihabitans donghaensis]
MDKPHIEHRPSTAIALKLTAVFLFMCMAAMIKEATQEVPPGQAVFFRSSCAIPVILLWLAQRGELREGLIPNNLLNHIWRGVFGTSAMILTFGGLMLIPLPEATAIGYATPMFTVILAAVFLGERVRIFRLSAVALGLFGVMIVMAPRMSLDADTLTTGATLGAFMTLAAALLRALVQIHVRKMVASEHTAAIVFYFSLTATCLSLLSIPFGWVWPSPYALSLVVCAGLVGGVAQIMVTSSYRFGAASMLAPFDYSSLIFASIIGYVIFSETVTLNMALGAGLVVAGGVIIIWRERQLGMDRAKSRAATAPKGE